MSRARLVLSLAVLGLLLAACGDGTTGGQDAIIADDPPDASAPADALPDPTDTAADALLDLADADADADAGPDAAPGPVEQHVDACRDWLAGAQPFFALEEAEAALALDSEHPHARLCAALAKSTHHTEFALSLFTLVDMAATYAVAPEPSLDEFLGGELHEVVSFLHAGFAEALVHLDAIADQDIAFDVESVWIYRGPRPVLVYRGRFDRGDVLLMRVVGRFVLGFLDILRGQDMKTDLATLIAYIVGDAATGSGLALGLDAVAYLLTADPSFLTLHPDDGEQAFDEARQILLDLGPSLREALEVIAAAPAPESGPEATTADSDGDGGYVLQVHSRVVAEGVQVLDEEPLVFELTPSILAGFDAVSASVAAPGTVTPFNDSVVPVLAVMLQAVIDIGVIGELALGPITIGPGVFSTSQLSELLQSLLPPLIGLDLGTFYAQPTGLRTLLPETTGPGAFEEDSLLISWECPEELEATGEPAGWQGLLCSKEAALTDAPHFEGTPWSLDADGYTSRFPYLAWADPTLNDLLYVDVSSVLPDVLPGFALADGTTINVALSEVLLPILGLMGD